MVHHWVYFLIRSLNLVFEKTRIIIKQAMVWKDSLKIFVHVNSHYSLYIIINQDNTIDDTLSGIVNCNTKQHWPTFHILVWRLREINRVNINFIFSNRIKLIVLLTFVKTLHFVGIQNWKCLFCLSMNQTCVTFIYWGIQNTLIVFVSILLVIMFSTKLIWIPIW